MSGLHDRLVALQTDEELGRKAEKAWQRKSKLWTQEEIDEAKRSAQRLSEMLSCGDDL